MIYWLIVITIVLWALVGGLVAVIFTLKLRDKLEESRVTEKNSKSNKYFCREALYGRHGEVNTSGNCPYCGLHLGVPRDWKPGRAGRTGSLRDDELEQTSWDRRSPQRSVVDPEGFLDEQDPLRSYDDDGWV